MTEWCLAHPWMTFWILIMFAIAISDIGPFVVVQRVTKEKETHDD